MKSMYKNLTWANGYEVHLGTTGRFARIPQEIGYNQEDYDGRTFKALVRRCDSTTGFKPEIVWMRVRLVGSDYSLGESGTGDMTVRPVAYC